MRTLFSRGLLCAALAFSLTACDSGDDDGDRSSLSGVVLSPTGNPVVGATVSTASDAAPAGTAGLRRADATTDENGAYDLDLDPGTYTLTITRPGYNPQTVSVTVDGDSEAPDVRLEGGATITGIINSSQGGRLGGAEVNFAFTDNVTGDPLDAPYDLTVTTLDSTDTNDEDLIGTFTITGAPTGTFDCVVYSEGFEPTVIPGIGVEDGANDLGESAVVETPPSGAVRVTLSWGQFPFDLDSHLTGPDGQGGRYHVYFSNEEVETDSLDTDDTDSYGPETITFYPRRRSGMYRYSVHNYTDRNSALGGRGIAGLAGNGQPLSGARPARVEVVVSNAQGVITDTRVYTAPTAGSGDDADTWRVFEIDASGDQLTIRDGAGSGLGYFQSSSSSDTDVFRTAGEVWNLPRK